MTEQIVPYEQLKALCEKKLVEAGIPARDAAVTADVLVHANLRGVDSHGVMRTEHYVKRITEGGINPVPHISIKETGPVSAIVDGDDGLGHIVSKRAMEKAIELAKRNGIGTVAVINSSHCGALSYFVNQCARENLIGMAMTHTDKFVVPFGAAQPFFGTNPIAYGFPARKNGPVILDMATSNVALGKVLDAKEKGKAIPDDWGVDSEGRPTTIPDEVKYLLPFGGPKGYGLGMVVDIFSGILTGSAFGPSITTMYGDYDKKRKLGHFFMAINPEIFTSLDRFLENMDKMIDDIHALQPAKGFQKVMVPGEPEQLNENEKRKSGISLPPSIYNYLITETAPVGIQEV